MNKLDSKYVRAYLKACFERLMETVEEVDDFLANDWDGKTIPVLQKAVFNQDVERLIGAATLLKDDIDDTFRQDACDPGMSPKGGMGDCKQQTYRPQ